MPETAHSTASTKWHADWQSQTHAQLFDGRTHLSYRKLADCYESFNDVRLLNSWLERPKPGPLLEVGCATGEFYRYLHKKFSHVSYLGMDISIPAIERAKSKYPDGRFFQCDPQLSVKHQMESWRLLADWPTVYSKDVLHHQEEPWGFLKSLIEVTSEALILRTRTRDVGTTVLDPERSCQFHYQGWMPYLVFHLEELVEKVREIAGACEIVIVRNHMILGGKENRFLPKECYLPETGTAETAIGIFRKSPRAGAVEVRDQSEASGKLSLKSRLRATARQLLEV